MAEENAAPEVVEKAEGALKRKLGPLPAWAWLLIVVAGAWGFYLWRKHTAATNGTTAPTVAVPSVAASDTQPDTSGSANATPNASQPDSETNAQWAIRVGNAYASSQGTYTPTDIANALSVLLSGGTPTQEQQTIINAVELAYGYPPQGIIPSPNAAVGSSGTAVPTGQYHTYITKKGDTIEQIIQATYGENDAAITAAVTAINPGVTKNGYNHAYLAGDTIKLPIFSPGPLP